MLSIALKGRKRETNFRKFKRNHRILVEYAHGCEEHKRNLSSFSNGFLESMNEETLIEFLKGYGHAIRGIRFKTYLRLKLRGVL